MAGVANFLEGENMSYPFSRGLIECHLPHEKHQLPISIILFIKGTGHFSPDLLATLAVHDEKQNSVLIGFKLFQIY